MSHRAALAVALVAVCYPASATSERAVVLRPLDRLEPSIAARVGALRRDAGLARVAFSRELTDAAESHAAVLARSGTFSHHAPGEKAFSLRLQSFYSARGFSYWATGENIFWSRAPTTPARIVTAWIASRPHLLNLLDRRWRHVGVAAVRVPSAPGVYGGSNVAIVVIEFGTRR